MKHSIDELPGRGEKVWFTIRPDSHEGPFAYDVLSKKFSAGELRADNLVWARGWPEALPFHQIHSAYGGSPAVEEVNEPFRSTLSWSMEDDQVPPALPKAPARWPWVMAALLMVGGGFWINRHLPAQTDLLRPSDMDVESFRKIKLSYEQMDRPIPIADVIVSADYRTIWLADRATQACHYEVSFHSAVDKNLSGRPVSFQAAAPLIQHWVTLQRLNFTEGQKLMPGQYQMTLVRQDCAPQGIASWWEKPLAPLSLSLAVEIFHGPREELRARLDNVGKKKEEEEKRRLELSRQSWRDIEEKLRTLSAIASQIETGFGELLNRKLAWKPRLTKVVDQYTMRFGSFLTNFIVKNDEDFATMAGLDIPDKVELMGQQPLINAHAKRIGFLSMSLIERLQKNPAAPNRSDLQDWLRTLEQDFGVEKEKLRLAVEFARAAATREVPRTEDPATENSPSL